MERLISQARRDIEKWVLSRKQSEFLDPARKTSQGVLKEPEYVEFHPADSGRDCDDINWEDPETFTRRRSRNGYVEWWGIYPHRRGARDIDGNKLARRWRMIDSIYQADEDPPEVQFVAALVENKIFELEDVDLGDLPQCDFTLYISLPFIKSPRDQDADRYWRRIRVSAGLQLSVFADKVLTPLFGWIRNLHAHVFQDFKDGAVFGPLLCDAVDMMHVAKSGYIHIPENGYCLAHILRVVGEVMGYHYDLGDNWHVDIKLEAITPKEESTGAVVVLDGAGGALPDGDFLGTFNWAQYFRRAAHSRSDKQKAMNKLFASPNYATQLLLSRIATFSFDVFDIEATRKAIRDALDSPASLPWASKKYIHPGSATRMNALLGKRGQQLRGRAIAMKKGQVMSHELVGDGEGGRVILEEGISADRSDNPGNTACANCGSPHNLRQCKRCQRRFYCGAACQIAHWQSGHKAVCNK